MKWLATFWTDGRNKRNMKQSKLYLTSLFLSDKLIYFKYIEYGSQAMRMPVLEDTAFW